MNIMSIQKPVGQLNILVFLNRNGKVSGKFIKHRIGLNPHTASSALSNLKELKLIRGLVNDNYTLTKKGKQVAEYLDQVEKLLPERKL
jgi:Mn-dependent DtxR family transcriptional regulator